MTAATAVLTATQRDELRRRAAWHKRDIESDERVRLAVWPTSLRLLDPTRIACLASAELYSSYAETAADWLLAGSDVEYLLPILRVVRRYRAVCQAAYFQPVRVEAAAVA